MKKNQPVKITRVDGKTDLELPKYQTIGSAGMDLMAAIDEKVEINQGDTKIIATGLAISLPEGFEAQIRPRSGLAIKHGLTVVNAPGTIDSDYRGEIKVGLINLGKEKMTINRGDRIAQMIISSYERIEWDEVESLDETERAAGGFGHTGR